MGFKDYNHEEIYDSDASYLYNAKDKPSWKIFYYMYLNQSKPQKIILDIQEYMSAKLIAFKSGVITKSQYSTNTLIEFLSMLKKYRIIRSLPKRLDDRFIKVIEYDKATIIQDIESRIKPDEKFKQEISEKRGKEILEILD